MSLTDSSSQGGVVGHVLLVLTIPGWDRLNCVGCAAGPDQAVDYSEISKSSITNSSGMEYTTRKEHQHYQLGKLITIQALDSRSLALIDARPPSPPTP